MLPCTGQTDLFYGSAVDREHAKRICTHCPERSECLAGALERREPDGVWAGVDFGNAAARRAARAAIRDQLCEVA